MAKIYTEKYELSVVFKFNSGAMINGVYVTFPFDADKTLPSQHRTSPVGSLKVLKSGTYMRTLGGSQGTNTKIDKLMKKFFFRSNSSCITYLFLFFYRKNNYSKNLTGEVHGTSTGSSCGKSRGPNDWTF